MEGISLEPNAMLKSTSLVALQICKKEKKKYGYNNHSLISALKKSIKF
jgi:hypothetical protein